MHISIQMNCELLKKRFSSLFLSIITNKIGSFRCKSYNQVTSDVVAVVKIAHLQPSHFVSRNEYESQHTGWGEQFETPN